MAAIQPQGHCECPMAARSHVGQHDVSLPLSSRSGSHAAGVVSSARRPHHGPPTSWAAGQRANRRNGTMTAKPALSGANGNPDCARWPVPLEAARIPIRWAQGRLRCAVAGRGWTVTPAVQKLHRQVSLLRTGFQEPWGAQNDRGEWRDGDAWPWQPLFRNFTGKFLYFAQGSRNPGLLRMTALRGARPAKPALSVANGNPRP